MAQKERPTAEPEDDVLKAVEAAETATEATPETAPPVFTPEPPRAESAPPRPPVEPRSATPGPAPEKRRGGGFLGTVLGGVIAAAAGYALAVYQPIPGLAPAPTPAVDPAEVQALASRLAELEQRPQTDPGLAGRLAALENRPAPEAPPAADLSPLTEGMSALEARIARMERSPAPAGGSATPAEIESLRDELAAGIEAKAAEAEARLAEAQAQAVALKADAEETARRIAARAAIGRVQAALESGAPFASALAELPGVDVPAALSDHAATGIPSRAALENAFAAPAREAISASLHADMGESWGQRFSSLLQSSAGVRSLTPREGDGPDAVLSRAEAAAKAGDLPAALALIATLPPEGQAAMAGWVASAQQRIDATAAAADLAATVGE